MRRRRADGRRSSSVGYPWIDEVLSLAMKYPNSFIDSSASAAPRLPDPLIELMRGPGVSRVMFGTNWPMLTPRRCLHQIDQLHLDEDARAALGGNARRVFRL